MASTATVAGFSMTMIWFICAQFICWAAHDGLQQYMFEQPGFSPYGTTMVREGRGRRPWTDRKVFARTKIR